MASVLPKKRLDFADKNTESGLACSSAIRSVQHREHMSIKISTLQRRMHCSLFRRNALPVIVTRYNGNSCQGLPSHSAKCTGSKFVLFLQERLTALISDQGKCCPVTNSRNDCAELQDKAKCDQHARKVTNFVSISIILPSVSWLCCSPFSCMGLTLRLNVLVTAFLGCIKIYGVTIKQQWLLERKEGNGHMLFAFIWTECPTSHHN